MKWLTFIGITVAAASIAALFLSANLWFMITMFLVSGIGIGAGLPCLDALITEGIDKEERGTVTSLYSSMRFIGVAAGPPTIAFLMKNSDPWIFIVLSFSCIVAALTTFKAIKPQA